MIRRALAFGALALSACGSGGAVQEQAEEGAKPVDCALGEGSDFGPFCMLETGELDGESLVTIRHPDGGFRRFVVQEDGSGLAVADGADAWHDPGSTQRLLRWAALDEDMRAWRARAAALDPRTTALVIDGKRASPARIRELRTLLQLLGRA